MSLPKVVLVTGVAGYWGSRVAARLLARPDLRVIGLDSRPPKASLGGLDFVQADVRNPLLGELFRGEEIDAVCHLAFLESGRPDEKAFDVNVMGTIRVVGAAAEAGITRVVLASSTMVYGARPDNSAFLTEAHPLHGSNRHGTVRDLVEIESFCSGFSRQASDMCLTILRFANVVGPHVESPMTRFLTQSWTPVLLGFDPLMQVIHEEDAVGALVHGVMEDVPGVYNLAAEGVMPLRRLMAIAGKVPIPVLHLGVYWGEGLLRAAGIKAGRYVPFDPDYLRYSWVADTSKMRERFGYLPHYTAAEALREFAGVQRLARYLPEKLALAYDEERLRDTIERRRRTRAQQAEAEEAGADGAPLHSLAGEARVDDGLSAAAAVAGDAGLLEEDAAAGAGGPLQEYEVDADGD